MNLPNRQFQAAIRPAFRRLSIALLLSLSPALHAQSPSPGVAPVQDVITSKGGSTMAGHLRSLDASGAKMDVTLPGGGRGTVSIPLANIEKIDFAPVPGEEEALAATSAADIAKVRILWERLDKHLTIPDSRAGEAGLKLANLLLLSERSFDWEEALALSERVFAKSWDHARRQQARRTRLQALIKLDRAAEATVEARHMLEQADDQELLIEANLVIATSTFAELKLLQEENPRWEQDDRVRPKRAALYQETLDRFLYPSLFYFRGEETAAKGLWGAVELYEFCGEAEFAARRAFDLVQLYPRSSFVPRAQELLKKHEQQKVIPESGPLAPEPAAVAAPEAAPEPEPERELTEREKRRLKRKELEEAREPAPAPEP